MGHRENRLFAVAFIFILCCVGAFAQSWQASTDTQAASPDAQTDAEEFEATRAAIFARLDADGNGCVEIAEWPGRQKAFRLLDVNRDGCVTLVEFQSRKARWWTQVFENLDLDGNRAITREEWMDVPGDFDRLDHNKDGIIERREFYRPR